MKIDDILDGLASHHDAVSNVFFGAVGNGPNLHRIFLVWSIEGFHTMQTVLTIEYDYIC